MSKPKGRPLFDHVVVEVKVEEKKTAILLDESVRKSLNQDQKMEKGTVVLVGNGTKDVEMIVKEGDEVLFIKNAGDQIVLDGKNYILLKQSYIVYVL